MKKQTESRWWSHVAGMVGWPILLGLAACSLFYVAIFRGPLDWPVLHRYFAGHPVSFFETAFFFVGASALLMKLVEVVVQAFLVDEVPVDPPTKDAPAPEEAMRLLNKIEGAGERVRQSYFGRRLRDAANSVIRAESADHLEEELKYLADQEAERQHESYALVRIVIWAIPMLGFLGTVMGIAQALGNLDPQQLATNPAEAMQGLLAGLYVAFDTTAVALTMAMTLMFMQFPIDRVERQLLDRITDRAADTLLGRFHALARNLDPHLASIERMCYAVMRSVEGIVDRQADIWRQSLTEMHAQWHEGWEAAGQQLQESLAHAMDRTLHAHAERMAHIEQRASESAERRWEQWQSRLEQSAAALGDHQEALHRQSELLTRIFEATGDVIQLEKALNDNLRELAGARHFEETVTSLSAAIQLLSARLQPAGDVRRIDLRGAQSAAHGGISHLEEQERAA